MFYLNHVNFNVSDIQRSMAFYEKAFGLREVRRITPEDGAFLIVFLSDGASDFSVELTWLRGKQGKYNLGDNETHLCLAADDFEAAYALHAGMGVICYENTGMGVYFVEDPDGYWIEIKKHR